MDDYEIKNLKAKVALFEGIKQDNHMLMYSMKSTAKRILTLLREANGRKEQGISSITLTPSEFDQVWHFVSLAESGSFGAMDNSAELYESAKITKEEILKLL
jgi:hypothetical protein